MVVSYGDITTVRGHELFYNGKPKASTVFLRQFRTVPISVDAEQPGQLKQIRPGNAWGRSSDVVEGRDGT